MDTLILILAIAAGTTLGSLAQVYVRAVFLVAAARKRRKQHLALLDEFEKTQALANVEVRDTPTVYKQEELPFP